MTISRVFAVDASGTVFAENCGLFGYFYLQAASAPILVSFDGGNNWVRAAQNNKFQVPKGNGVVFLKSYNGVAANGNFVVSTEPIQSQDTNISVNSTSTVGNFGFIANLGSVANNIAAPRGGNTLIRPATTAEGYVRLGAGDFFSTQNLAYPTRYGTQQLITITNIQNAVSNGLCYGAANPLNIYDSSWFSIARILQPGESFTLPTADFFVLNGAGGNAWFTVAQVFAARQTT